MYEYGSFYITDKENTQTRTTVQSTPPENFQMIEIIWIVATRGIRKHGHMHTHTHTQQFSTLETLSGTWRSVRGNVRARFTCDFSSAQKEDRRETLVGLKHGLFCSRARITLTHIGLKDLLQRSHSTSMTRRDALDTSEPPADHLIQLQHTHWYCAILTCDSSACLDGTSFLNIVSRVEQKTGAHSLWMKNIID